MHGATVLDSSGNPANPASDTVTSAPRMVPFLPPDPTRITAHDVDEMFRTRIHNAFVDYEEKNSIRAKLDRRKASLKTAGIVLASAAGGAAVYAGISKFRNRNRA